MATKEINIQRACMLEAGSDPDVLIWRQHVGAYRALDAPERIIKVGLPGQADACMAVSVTITPDMVGKRIAVLCQPEFKAPKGRQAVEQKRWQIAIERLGGIYRLIRSVDDLRQMIEDVKRGRW